MVWGEGNGRSDERISLNFEGKNVECLKYEKRDRKLHLRHVLMKSPPEIDEKNPPETIVRTEEYTEVKHPPNNSLPRFY